MRAVELVLAVGWAAFWLYWLVAAFPINLLYSATVEEHYMAEQFTDTYPVYKRSTKMLVPFIF